MFEWDGKKNKSNTEKHGLAFDLIEEFDFSIALTKEDTRQSYDERRFNSLGYIREDLVSVTWTPRGKKIRIISLRRARAKERKHYEE